MRVDIKAVSPFLVVLLLACLTWPVSFVSAGDDSWSTETIPDTTGMQLAPGTDVSDIAVSGDNTTIYAADSEADKIYKSTDAGVNWAEITKPTGATEPQLVAVASDNASLVAIVADGNGAYVSTNGGSIWGNLGVPTDASALTDAAISEAYNGNNYLAVSGNTTSGAAEVWYYKLGIGGAWVKAASSYAGEQADTTQALAVAFSPNFSSDQVLLALTDNATQVLCEIFSLDLAAWNTSAGFDNYPVAVVSNDGITGVNAASLALDPAYDGTVQTSRVAIVGLDIAGDADAAAQSGVYGLYDYDVTFLESGVAVSSVAFNGSRIVAGITYDSSPQVRWSTDVQKSGSFADP